MKKCFVVALSIGLMVGGVQAATLTPKAGVSILYINGEAAESKISENHIEAGFNQVVVRMDKDMSRGSSSDVFTSKPYVLSFTVNGEHIEINHPKARSRVEAERAFESNPQWIVIEDDKLLRHEQVVLKGNVGFVPYGGMAELIQKHNSQRGIYFNNGQLVGKPVVAQMLPVTTAVVVKPNQIDQDTVISGNVEQLKAWYLKSSAQERKTFRKWMIDQE
ncbi:DUF2057 family protein [Vibrio aestuarianus]|uniref:DUF2057 domain-containing protein n=1 Tax=Vibrio aestuarianus TaxID=28171 RepID=A0A9X4F5U8_9VIBR|nr:DUF2057 family protein [Vibrio aestuarianus]MDE1345618.1 DUF2057 domain-containing protein [Vibrio aestuarianus]